MCIYIYIYVYVYVYVYVYLCLDSFIYYLFIYLLIYSIPPTYSSYYKAPTTLQVPKPGFEGDVTGMGIQKGVTLIVGGGFHGKSTLLQAICYYGPRVRWL